MVFSSLTFLLFFLPAAVLPYYICPRRYRTARDIWLLLMSLVGDSLDEKALDSSRFDKEVRKNYWVGESGRKILGAACKIRDDLILLAPSYPVHLEYVDIATGEEASGGFSILTNSKNLENVDGTSSGSSPYYYYLSGNNTFRICNKDMKTGNLLIVKDSFSNVVLPFLSLSANQITGWDMRQDPKLYEHLEQHPEIKTVLVMYNISFIPSTEMNDFQ